MGLINVLDTQTSNMIAAGEVVDRPASAVKEMVENAVDAGAKSIAVEIKGGGMTFISVSDDGQGIMREDLPKTILRHATSKISCGNDLDGVRTLGFRGEALAAISSVSVTEIISKRRDEPFGNRLSCDETGVELYETGCPDGTTVTVRNLFYNVPARRKFMKKDSSEAAACSAVCEKLALSHPAISISFTVDGTRKFKTSGDGKLYSVIYTLYGAEFARTLIPVESEQDGITVDGFVSKPEFPRGSRNMQSFFVNNRYVRSKTAQAAVEEAYHSYISTGKFPAAILFIGISPKKVDVNVHPAKTEIKFSDEKSVFSAVYYAVLGAITPTPVSAHREEGRKEAQKPYGSRDFGYRNSSSGRAENPKPVLNTEKTAMLFNPSIVDSELTAIEINSSPFIGVREDLEPSDYGEKASFAPSSDAPSDIGSNPFCNNLPQFAEKSTTKSAENVQEIAPEEQKSAENMQEIAASEMPKSTFTSEQAFEQTSIHTEDESAPETQSFRIVGEAYHTYIIAEMADKLLIIDKHAAHERLIYEDLKKRDSSPSQELLFPITLHLTAAECELLLDNADLLEGYGFVLEPFGAGYAAVRAVPARLKDLNGLSEILEGFAHDLASSSALPFGEKADKALYTMACKAAVKAGDHTFEEDAEQLVKLVLETGVKYCPHGRPFVKELDKKTLEKFFDR